MGEEYNPEVSKVEPELFSCGQYIDNVYSFTCGGGMGL